MEKSQPINVINQCRSNFTPNQPHICLTFRLSKGSSIDDDYSDDDYTYDDNYDEYDSNTPTSKGEDYEVGPEVNEYYINKNQTTIQDDLEEETISRNETIQDNKTESIQSVLTDDMGKQYLFI